MHKKILIILLSLTFVLCGCSSENERTDNVPGFVKYVNTQYSMVFQYPSDWIYVDSSTTQEQLMDYCDQLNMYPEMVRLNLEDSIAVFYSLDKEHDDALRIMSLSLVADKELTLSSIKKVETQQEISDTLNNLYRKEYSEYELLQDIKSREYGKNFFLTYAYKANLYDETLAYFQAITGDDHDRCFMFIYGIGEELPENDVTNFEKILSSFEYGQEVMSDERASISSQ